MMNSSDHTPAGWLAFELSVLRRLRFRSMVNPFAGEPDLDATLKRWDVRVAVNDPAQWAWIKAVARVENNAERLTEEDVARLLEDVYVPGYRLRNGAARDARAAWREEFVRGNDDFWPELVRARAGKLDAHIETKQQYLRLVEELLDTATHIRTWAIAHVETGLVTTEELVETIRRI